MRVAAALALVVLASGCGATKTVSTTTTASASAGFVLSDQKPAPSFASNGTAMFFHTGRNGDARSALMSVDVTSPDLRVMSIVDDGARNYHVQPSPNERFIAFDSDRDGGLDLYVLEIATGKVTRLTKGLTTRGQNWSRDGKRMLFAGSGTGVDDIYVINVDGSGLTRLTHGTEGTR